MSSHGGAAQPIIVERSRLARVLPWIVAGVAAAAAVFWFARHLRRRGPVVEVTFEDGTGLTTDTLVVRRGIEIGKVLGLALSDDTRHAVVRIRLRRDADAFAREGATYWLVKPRLSEGSIGGLNALATGPYIEAAPGEGDRRSRFDGLGKPPPLPGLELVLASARLDGLSPGAPISYRGVQVGEVLSVRLADSGDAAEARAVVWQRYAPLVRAGTKFWRESGFSVEGGVLKGLTVKMESLRELASGGLSFATPSKDAGAAAKDGQRFSVADKPDKGWLSWAPKITLEPGAAPQPKLPVLPTGQDLKQSKTKAK